MRYCPACHSVYPNDFRTCPKDQSELRSASELQPGMVLRGKYEVLDKIGAGGMATVYRARHLAFDEVRAIKVVAGRLADDEDFLRRFRNEAVVARRFQHPHAVRVDDLDTTEDGRPFIVMEYVEGINLREAVRREGPLQLRRALTIARQVASALSAAHDLGIVHRDIKPDNILLAGTGAGETAKVLDFGIAKVKEGFLSGSDHVATRTGAVVGTPQYISPEQALGRRGDELDGRADLYSLGVVLYEMVTGRLPFESDTAMGIILKHLQTPPTPPHELRPDLGIPEPLSAVLMKALDKERERRYGSAAEMMAALDTLLALPLPETVMPARAAAAGGDTPGPPSTPRPIPADIDRHETRMMPRTPPGGTHGGAEPARPLPMVMPTPSPGALPPMPVPTAIAPKASTPIPLPTLHQPPAGTGFQVPFPLTPASTPPPLPSGFGLPTPPKGRRTWLKWAGIGLAFYVFCGRSSPISVRRSSSPRSSPSARAGAAVEEDPAVRDARLRADVQRALYGSPRIRTEAIAVDVDEGEITLSGRASSRAVAVEAETLAREVSGVTSVENDLHIVDDQANPNPNPNPELSLPPLPDFGDLASVPAGAARERAIAELVQHGRHRIEAGDAEGALAAFSAAVALDPRNQQAAAGTREAGRLIRDRVRRPPRRPPPPAPTAPSPEG